MSGSVRDALSAVTPPGLDFAPQEYVRQDTARKIVANLSKARCPALEELKAAGAKGISRRMYPLLVELKIAGRSMDDIARRLRVSVDILRPHLQRAMEEYRSGQLRINGGNAVQEARAKGAEGGEEFAEQCSQSGTSNVVQLTIAIA